MASLGGWRRGPDARPLVLGHRGARSRAPENTFAAFDLAVDAGADGVELDVRLCGSGQVVVCHDPTLERVTGARDVRAVESVSLLDLARVDVGSGERVPTLQAVLDWAAHRQTRLNIEVKRDVRDLPMLVDRVTALVRTVPDAPDRILLSSFDLRAVHRLAGRLRGVAVGWLVHQGQHLFRGAHGWRWLGARALHPEHTLVTSRSIARWKRQGALVNAWTVNDTAAAQRLADLGVDTLISDDPRLLLEAVDQNHYGKW